VAGDDLPIGGTFGPAGRVAPGVIGSETFDGVAVDRPSALDFDAAIGPLIQPGFRLALLMLDDPAEAEDAVQEAAVKAWRKLRTVRAEVRPWFFAIVANECRSVRRRRWFSVIRRDDIDTPTAWRDPADGAELRRAVRTLSAEHRMVIALRFYLDLSLEDVAATLGTPVGTVKSRLHRAVQALRAALGEEAGG
jgi:RNA polymerase sigma-70 factor, ECF subfamily